ncbi:hypothetical protein VPH35_010439 [Triticum aestivum]
MADERSRRGGAEAGPYVSDARVRPQSTRTQRPPDTGNGAEAAGSGDSRGADDERLHGRRPAGFKRRLKRENFHLEGPTGVMKRLEALWKIMELTDTELINW